MIEEKFRLGLTFDDVLLVPAKSEVIPKLAEVKTQLTDKISMNIPLVSSAMDTVTEARLAIALAQEGGVGIIHKNFSIERQAAEVDKVKRSVSGMIVDPITMGPHQRIYEALEIMEKYRISGVPITEKGRLVGILTNRDLRFVEQLDRPISEFMTKDNLITVPIGTTLEQSKELLHRNRIEKLLVVDENYCLKGLITIKDIEKSRKYPNACKDSMGRLIVGAAIGITDNWEERVDKLVQTGVDVVVVDSAHGHQINVVETIVKIRKNHPTLQLIGGNVATEGGAEDLIRAGVNAIKVGIGPGSICTTRIVTGVGVPQLSAVMECARISEKYGIPLIADGGIKYSGDLTKAIAAGAHSAMIGSLFAGTEESPGEKVLYQGRSYKVYRGMGSVEAMRSGSSDRYFQEEELSEAKLVPEGVEGRIPFKGPLSSVVYQLVGGLKAGMGYCGCSDISELRRKARFIRISQAGLRESHVHDVIITKEAPNYQIT